MVTLRDPLTGCCGVPPGDRRDAPVTRDPGHRHADPTFPDVGRSSAPVVREVRSRPTSPRPVDEARFVLRPRVRLAAHAARRGLVRDLHRRPAVSVDLHADGSPQATVRTPDLHLRHRPPSSTGSLSREHFIREQTGRSIPPSRHAASSLQRRAAAKCHHSGRRTAPWSGGTPVTPARRRCRGWTATRPGAPRA